MIKKIILATAIASTVSSPILACTGGEHGGIARENNLWISADQKSNGMTEEIFNSVLDRIGELYTPVIADRKKVLKIERNWEDGTVNAYAQQAGNTWKIAMFGGLARHEKASADGFALVACHELGHHLGGAPKRTLLGFRQWASNEGQSDYWGSSKCFRKYMELDNNVELMKDIEIPQTVKTKCENSFSNEEDRAMCFRNSLAGESLSNVLASLRQSTSEINFDTPDMSEVGRTDHNHPEAQCRLDTYFAGAICAIDHNLEVDERNTSTNVCSRTAGDVDGIRPRCWFKKSRRY